MHRFEAMAVAFLGVEGRCGASGLEARHGTLGGDCFAL